MKSQVEIRADIDRLLAEGSFDEAEALIDLLLPVRAEEFWRRVDAAPYYDEPVTPVQRASLDRAWEVIKAIGTIPRPAPRYH